MNKILSVLYAVICFAFVESTYGASAEFDFIRQWLESGAQDDTWCPRGIPGGYIHRFRCDITGDNKEEIFLCLPSFSERDGGYWTIYSPQPDSSFVPIGTDIYINDDGFYRQVYQDVPQMQLVSLTKRYTDSDNALVTYSYTLPGILTEVRAPISRETYFMIEKKTPGWEQSLGLGTKVIMIGHIEKLLVFECITNPNAVWRPAYRGGYEDQDPSDGAAIASVPPGFTPEVALSYLTPPTLTAFTPASGHSGTAVTLTGTNFTGATAVRFGPRDASSFTVNSPTRITAHPPDVSTGVTTNGGGGGTAGQYNQPYSGKVSVVTPAGTATCPGASFSVTAVPWDPPGPGGEDL